MEASTREPQRARLSAQHWFPHRHQLWLAAPLGVPPLGRISSSQKKVSVTLASSQEDPRLAPSLTFQL